MIVVFSINWSRMFALYVCRMSCKLELKTLNNRKMTASLRNHQKRRVCSNPCICTTQWYSGGFSRVLHEIWRIFLPIIWYCCNIQRPYKISNILYKTNEKAVSFFIDHIQNVMWPFPSAFIFVSLFGNTDKVCCSLLQWCDVGTVVWCRTCTVRFSRSLLRLFSSFLPIWVCEMKVLSIFPCQRFETCFYT